MNASDVIRRLQQNLKSVRGITLYMQPVQNITVDDRVSRTQYQYTLEDPDANELNLWTDRFVAKLEELPQLADVATDRQNRGLAASLVIDRVTASRLGIAPSTLDNTLYDAFGQRQVNTLYTQLNQYHVIPRALAALPAGPQDAAEDVHSPTRLPVRAAGATTSFAASGSSAAGSTRSPPPVNTRPPRECSFPQQCD